MSDKKRVVITGAGIVSPIGIGRDEFWNGIAAGKSGVSKIDLLSGSALPGHVAGECKDFTDASAKKQYLTAQRKSIKVMCREIQLGVASAHLALANSELDIATIDHERLGVDFGANQMFSTPARVSSGAMKTRNSTSTAGATKVWLEWSHCGCSSTCRTCQPATSEFMPTREAPTIR